MNNSDSKALLKERAAFFAVFFALSCLYFYRVFLDGIIIAPGDASMQNYPLRVFYSEELKHFRIPLWSPYEFAGIPYIGAMQTGGLYPLNIAMYFALPPAYAFDLSFILHYALAGFFTFLYLRELDLGRLSSFAGGVVFGFSGFLMAHKPHTAIVDSAVWLPLIVFFFERLRKTIDIKYAFAASVAIAFQITAGNFQISIYTYFVVLIFLAVYLSDMDKGFRLKLLSCSSLALALGFLIASSHLFAVAEFSNLSLRKSLKDALGYKFFTSYHVYLSTLPTLISPYIFGGGDYGPAGRLGPEDAVTAFAGTLPLFMSIAVLIRYRKEKAVLIWGIIGVVGLILSLGSDTPIYGLLYKIPVLNLFRVPARHLLEFSFAVAVLSSIGLDRVFNNLSSRKLLYPISIMLAVSIAVLALLPVLFIDSLNYANPAILIPIFIMAAYLLLCLTMIKDKSVIFQYALVAVITAEAFSYGAFHEVSGMKIGAERGSYVFTEAYDYAKGAGLNRIMKLPSAFSGHSLFNVPERVGSINSYNQLAVERYSRFLGLNSEGVMPLSEEHLETLLKNNLILSVLNTKHVVVSAGVNVKGLEDSGLYKPVMDTDDFVMYENTHVLPRAYLASELIPAEDLEDAKLRFLFSRVSPPAQAVVYAVDMPDIGKSGFGTGTAEIIKYGVHEADVKVNLKEDGFLALSDQYYPGWRAFVDGVETRIYETNGVLRGVKVPAGEHVVAFKYLPYWFYFFSALGLSALIGIAAYLLFGPRLAKTA